MSEILTVNGNKYEIKKDLTFGQIKRINRSFSTQMNQEEIPDLSQSTPEQIKNLLPKLEAMQKMNYDQLELASDIIKNALDMTDDDLEKIPWSDVQELFKGIIDANQPKKKSSTQYA